MNLSNTISTGCPFCGTGCALNVECNGTSYKVKGDKSNPSTLGELCFKPIQMAKVLDTARLNTPLYRQHKHEPFKPISWDKAFSYIADNILQLPKNALYFYLSGQLLSEESYLFTKLIKGYLGTNNVDANSRLCMASAVIAHKMVFGSDGPVGNYKDIDDADVILISGSNPAWAHPVVFRRILARKKSHPETLIITIDPIRTETAEKSDLWIGLNSGSDTTLYNAILSALHKQSACDIDFIRRVSEGFEQTLSEAQKISFESAIEACGISQQNAEQIVQCFASDKKIVGLWCQGLNQATDGVMRNIGFMNLFLATGRLNASRGCPISLTGQPNAMGGREVGYLSNGLPGYRDVRTLSDRQTCENHWNLFHNTISPIPGITITDAIDSILTKDIRFLWVTCTNPLLTLPDLNKTEHALNSPDLFLVVQDCVMSETAAMANLILPTHTWGEKEGSMTNSERYIKRIRPFKPAPDGSKSDLDIIYSVAQKLGFSGFEYTNIKAVYDEYKALSENRLCDQSTQEYNSISYQWGGERLYSNQIFATTSTKVQFHPVISSTSMIDPDKFILITGRTKKQWHTMTRTGLSNELLKEEEEPYLLMNSDEAEKMGIDVGDTVIIKNDLGTLELPIRFGKLAYKHLFAPFGYPQTPINTLVPVLNDPFSSQSALKSAQVLVIKK
ncbi:MAG: molybdopterin-dependent oxidoreductase [Sulfuricurvum sp.]|uniref:molybdopterin oxidoreductase family protein n=1 Tax=Sulfuricurvum sp. TaxID=2025608 RepID=UPI0025D81252|nr:molybdopterin-dependent oxidoreductase [Sulfuricurvum sp.]MBV5322148.1 molybdopterin-dependent oxidoreductase [Sulfuricurvum sp.]